MRNKHVGVSPPSTGRMMSSNDIIRIIIVSRAAFSTSACFGVFFLEPWIPFIRRLDGLLSEWPTCASVINYSRPSPLPHTSPPARQPLGVSDDTTINGVHLTHDPRASGRNSPRLEPYRILRSWRQSETFISYFILLYYLLIIFSFAVRCIYIYIYILLIIIY